MAEALNIAILAAGAGGMYCGSCLRDNALAGALVRKGQRVTLVPMYTPLKTDEVSCAIGEVFFGGVNVYLQHASAVFRHTPRAVDWLLDRDVVLKLAGDLGAQTPPAQLGPLTISILKGEDGPAVKEVRRLVQFLKKDARPHVISLPNLMFIGLARVLREEVGAAIVCELTGEDLFLGGLIEPHRSEAQAIIRSCAADVAGFVATSAYYAEQMSVYLAIGREKIAVVHPSVPTEYVTHTPSPGTPGEGRGEGSSRAPTIGYMARVCEEKGFGNLVHAVKFLRAMPGMSEARILAGGYLGGRDRKWLDELLRNMPAGMVEYVGEVDRDGKLALLDSVDVLSVPATYEEAKGIYVLEAMSRGVPVVQPGHGSFPELIEMTGGGILTPPGDLPALASALAELLGDPARRRALGEKGRASVATGFTDDHMAGKMLTFYRDLLAARPIAYHPATT